MTNLNDTAVAYKKEAVKFITIGLIVGLIIGCPIGFLTGLGSGISRSAQQVGNTVEKVGDTAIDGAKSAGEVLGKTYKENEYETHEAVKESTAQSLEGAKEVATAGKKAALRVLDNIGKKEGEKTVPE